MEVCAIDGEIMLMPLTSRGGRATGCVTAIPVVQIDEMLMAMRAAAASIPGSGYDDTKDLPGD